MFSEKPENDRFTEVTKYFCSSLVRPDKGSLNLFFQGDPDGGKPGSGEPEAGDVR